MPGTRPENRLFIADIDGKDHAETTGGVELLFFIYDDSARDGFTREPPAIRRRAGRIMFTAHLPDRPDAEADALAGLLSPLVRRFAVHPCEDAPKPAARLWEWDALYGKGRFLLENTAAGLPEGLLPLLDGGRRLAALLPFLRAFTGIVSIGLFDWDGICAGLSCMERGLRCV